MKKIPLFGSKPRLIHGLPSVYLNLCLKVLGSISHRVRTSPNLGLVLGDKQIEWIVVS